MPRLSVLAALGVLLLGPLVAGCVTAPGGTTAGMPSTGAMAANVTAPKVDAKAMLTELKAFSEAYPKRNVDNDAHNGARAYLKAAYEKAGLSNVTLDAFKAPNSQGATPTGGSGEVTLVNVCAFHWGATNAKEWVVLGAHYDVTDGAVFGAYDDGSGTMIVQHLARAFAKIETARTIVFCNFDGEEQGLKGSNHMVKTMAEGSWIMNNGTVIAEVDFDMAGINYPADAPLVADVVSPEMKAIIAAKASELKMPNGSIEYRPVSGGSSDNGPFKAINISSVLFISDFDKVALPAVGVLPAPLSNQVKYPFWHQMDTYDGMVQLAGGEDNLVKGTQNVLDLGADLVARLAGDMPAPHFEKAPK
jgi:hypothetical protein